MNITGGIEIYGGFTDVNDLRNQLGLTQDDISDEQAMRVMLDDEKATNENNEKILDAKLQGYKKDTGLKDDNSNPKEYTKLQDVYGEHCPFKKIISDNPFVAPPMPEITNKTQNLFGSTKSNTKPTKASAKPSKSKSRSSKASTTKASAKPSKSKSRSAKASTTKARSRSRSKSKK